MNDFLLAVTAVMPTNGNHPMLEPAARSQHLLSSMFPTSELGTLDAGNRPTGKHRLSPADETSRPLSIGVIEGIPI